MSSQQTFNVHRNSARIEEILIAHNDSNNVNNVSIQIYTTIFYLNVSTYATLISFYRISTKFNKRQEKLIQKTKAAMQI